jgi:GMP synthase-like glutamine amidotransferase
MAVDAVGGENPLTFRPMTADPGAVKARWKRTWRDRALVVHHGDAAPSGDLIRELSELGLEPSVVRAEESELPPPESLMIGVLVGTDRFARAAGRAHFDTELEWVRLADRVGTPILGIGHGARVLASALGGGVEPAERGQRGWALVDTSVPHFIPGGPWLAWQHEVIRLPPGAELLAHNRLGPQAFRLGRHLGIQFHPEATPLTATTWQAHDGEALDYHDTRTATRRDPAAARSCARRLFSSFLESV